MRKFLFVLVLLGFPLSQLFSISKIDSLTLLLNKTTDTTKINVLFELIDLVIDNDPPKSLKYIEQASEIAKKKSLYIFKGRCLKLKGDYFKKHGDYTQALELYHQAVEIFQKNKAYKFIASVYNNIGATYVDKGDYQNSATYLIKSLRIFEQINDKA